MNKTDIKVGDKGYLRQFTSNSYINMVKRPVTVIAVDKSRVTVQYCKLIAPVYHCCGNPMLDRPDLEGQRVFFYDTIAEKIEPDPNGRKETLSWHSRRELWGEAGRSDSEYPLYLITSEGYQHQPYLD